MKKDVIYIDIEDDITAVIEKIKGSSAKIVALVPPKGSAVLQSVVNLKLVKRAAAAAKKQPVLITSNQALLALAGGLDLYVAKNLQSKPAVPGTEHTELTDEPVEVSDEIGDLDDTGKKVDLHTSDDSDEVELSAAELSVLDDANTAKPESKKKGSKKSAGKKVPNFGSFRKKLLIGGGVALLLLVVAVMVFGRTKAEVTVRAETTPVDVMTEVVFDANNTQSNPESRNLRAQIQEIKRTVNQSFEATGEKDLGTKASGNMSIANCSDNPITIPAGTGVSSDGLTFITARTLRLDAGNFTSGGICRSSGNHVGSTQVTAAENGDKYNLSPRNNYSVAGFNGARGRGGQMSGGTSRIVKTVSQDDVDRAQEQLNQQDTAGIRDELKNAFGEDVVVLDDTFTTTFNNARSEPAVGEEANEGSLSAEVSYSILAVAKKDLGAVLDAAITEQMTNQDQQRVYQNGMDTMKLEKVSGDARTATFRVNSLGYYGPQFDVEDLKQQITDKKVGEVRSYLQDLPGVKGVDISLSPFWARSMPNPDRIDITLEVDDN